MLEERKTFAKRSLVLELLWRLGFWATLFPFSPLVLPPQTKPEWDRSAPMYPDLDLAQPSGAEK